MDSLARTREKAILVSMGVEIECELESDDSEELHCDRAYSPPSKALDFEMLRSEFGLRLNYVGTAGFPSQNPHLQSGSALQATIRSQWPHPTAARVRRLVRRWLVKLGALPRIPTRSLGVKLQATVRSQCPFLSHTVSRKIRNVVDKFPDIGKSIEAFVEASNVGADAWR